MVTNLADPKVRLQLMHDAVAELSKEQRHAFVLAHLILTSIDGLSRSSRKQTSAGFKQMLTIALPQLASLISPADITAFIRAKTVHEFGIAAPYAIGWSCDSYVEDRVIDEVTWKVIDAQRMAAEFQAYVQSPAALTEQHARQNRPLTTQAPTSKRRKRKVP